MPGTYPPPDPLAETSVSDGQGQADSRLSLHVAETFSTEDRTQRAWDAAVEHLRGPVYMTYDWLRTWWKHYGAGKKLRLLQVQRNDEIVALLPVYIETFGWPPLGVRVARLVGANLPPKTFDPPVDSASAREALALCLDRLFTTDRCDLLSLGPVSDAWPGHAGFRTAADSLSDRVRPPTTHPRDSQTLFRLPATFDEYLEQLSPTERKNRMKRVRKLEREHPISSDIVSEPEAVVPEFESFIAQHAKQWEAIGKGGHFAAWPGAEAFNRELVQSQSARGRVRFFRLLAGQEVISSRYTFHFAGTVYSELPARAIGEPWNGLGVGAISLLKFTEQVISQGIRTVDSGIGAYDHKSSLGGTSMPCALLRCRGASLRSTAVSAVFLIFSSLFHVLFHKIWYRRLLPKLPPSFGRQQSLIWLRFDA